MAKLATVSKMKTKSLTLSLESLKVKGLDSTINAIVEGMELATYAFDEHLSKKAECTLEVVNLDTKEKAASVKKTSKSN